jgi:DNA-binding NarL/FixJ family response regulator
MRTMNILLVEKDPGIRDLVRVALQQIRGVKVEQADDRWALDLAREITFDGVCIADELEAPGDGILLLKDLRSKNCNGPAMLITHSQREAIPPEAQELNVVTMVNVPVETVELFKAIAALRDLVEGPG